MACFAYCCCLVIMESFGTGVFYLHAVIQNNIGLCLYCNDMSIFTTPGW